MSRSTWACELKSMRDLSQNSTQSHAPRERVSWNRGGAAPTTITPVTLHVSVWVEITKKFLTKAMRSSRSTWACELKFALWCTKRNIKGHAPRERVSWNFKNRIIIPYLSRHAPRERVSQFSFQRRTYQYWIIQITAWLRSGGIFIPKYYTFFMCFPSNPPIHTPKFLQTNDL